MVSLEVIGIGAIISYSIALFMYLTLICIRSFSNKQRKDEQHS